MHDALTDLLLWIVALPEELPSTTSCYCVDRFGRSAVRTSVMARNEERQMYRVVASFLEPGRL